MTAIVVGIAISGCSGTKQSTWSTPIVKAVHHFGPSTTLPFDRYQLSDDQLEAMQRGQAGLLTACAKTYGVVALYSGDYIRPANDPRLIWGGRLGLLDEAHAGSYGYHPTPTGVWAPVGGFYLRDPGNLQANPSSDPSTDNAVQLVTYGPNAGHATGVKAPQLADESGRPVPKGGCWGVVESKVGAELVSDLDVTADVYNLTLAHPQVKRAIASWSKCMAKAGYHFVEVQAPSKSFTLATLSADEITTALADVKCTQASGWADYFYTVLSDYERQAIRKNPDLFTSVLESQRHRLRVLSRLAG